MNRIDHAFNKGRSTNLIPFLMCADPSYDLTRKLLFQFEKEDVAVIELGFPYSDPLADGPVLQQSALRALKNDISLKRYFSFVKDTRNQGLNTPLVFFGYFNPVLQFGLERFFQEAKCCGLDGAIIPDLPYEESREAAALAEKHNIHLIPLIAPTSGSRKEKIIRSASGFVYCVSSLGVTGTRTDFDHYIDSFLHEVKQLSDIPVAVGFGISEREHVKRFSKVVDAVVVGSALAKIIHDVFPDIEEMSEADEKQAIETVVAFLRGQMKDSILVE